MLRRCRRFLLVSGLVFGFSSSVFSRDLSTAAIINQTYGYIIDSDVSGSKLKDELSNLVTETHVRVYHYNDVWEVLKNTDKVPGSDEVFLIYGYDKESSGKPFDDYTRHENENGGSQSNWNREHVFAKSVGGFKTEGPGADAHHLRASDVGFNGMRGNLPFVDGEGEARRIGEGWYPGDEWKGDVARMILYMYLRYPSNCAPKKIGLDRRVSSVDPNVPMIFIEWNKEDPPTDIEFQRNDYLGDATMNGQGNRNPFIDHYDWVDKAWAD